MYGALLGDYIGSPYEFDMGDKTKDFTMFNDACEFTDDSVMTLAVAEAMMDSMGKPDKAVKAALVRSMQDWGRFFPNAGYGGRFACWLLDEEPKPYGSYGNGSAMRVSSVGWLFDSLEETRKYARFSAEVTHNHPEGIKGAEATAAAIYLARTGHSKEEIRDYIVSEFDYDLSRTCDEIRPKYRHVESCQGTVPEAVTAFLEGEDFEDVIRTAVSLGGDCDTLTCIAGSMAEAFYGVPEEMKEKCRAELPESMRKELERFEERTKKAQEAAERARAERDKNAGAPGGPEDPFLAGNEMIEAMIAQYHADSSKRTLTAVLEAIRIRMRWGGHFLFPVKKAKAVADGYDFRTILHQEKLWIAAFTSQEERGKGPASEVISYFIDAFLLDCLDMEACEGIILNPFGRAFILTKEMIRLILLADAYDKDPEMEEEHLEEDDRIEEE